MSHTNFSFVKIHGRNGDKKDLKVVFEGYLPKIQSQTPLVDITHADGDPAWLLKDILYHLMLPVTPNGLREYYRYYDIDLKNFPFHFLLEQAGMIAEQVNAHILKKIGELIVYFESDETFKGRKTIFLVVIDKLTGFLLYFKQIPNRKQGTIHAALAPLQQTFCNLKVVFTDLAAYYPTVMRLVFPGADHQLCLIHGIRTLFKEYNKIRHRYHNAYGRWKDADTTLKKLKLDIRARQKKVSKKRCVYDQAIAKRTCLYSLLGIKPSQKGIYLKFPETKILNQTIGRYRAIIRSIEKTLAEKYQKRGNLARDLVSLNCELKTRWAEYMETCRIWHRFKSLLEGQFAVFGPALEIFQQILEKAHKKKELRPFVVKIRHLIKDYPGLFTLAKKSGTALLPPNFWNTNRVENFNGIFRSFSDLRRHFPNSEHTNALCAIWQLYYNTTPRRSKRNGILSPIERYGINLQGKNWVELLFDPLPRMVVKCD